MRRPWWLVLPLIGVAVVASAEPPAAVGTDGQGDAAARPTSPTLDLRVAPDIVPAPAGRSVTPPSTALINGPSADASGAGDRVSVGVKVRPRKTDPRGASREADPSSDLDDQIGRALEETTFGVTGTYRF